MSLSVILAQRNHSTIGNVEEASLPTHHEARYPPMANPGEVSDGNGSKLTTAVSQKFESLRKQFELQMAFSTFSATLIVAFASLIKSLLVESAHENKLFDVGLLMSFFTISCHIFIIAISGRSAFLSSDSQFTAKHDIELFRSALWTCEQLYMLAIYAFSATLLMMSFVVFEGVMYPAVYCGTVALGIVALFLSRLRYLMVLYQSVVGLKRLVVPDRSS